MAAQNAESHLKTLRAAIESDTRILVGLQKKLRMDRMPSRIECFDISSTAGKTAVAGMVTFYKGRPEPSLYRRYIIKTADSKDDYACMLEVLSRRYKKSETAQPLPDILMVDGGKGQLNIAASVISSLGLEKQILLLSIAKKDEKKGEVQDKVYRLGQVNPINFGRQGEVLLLVQRIRDEAHRCAITFHRKRRDRKAMHSALDSIPGVGRKRKALLLKHFKSVEKIRAATRAELRAVPGINRTTAEAVEKALAYDAACRQQPGR
jgi:excinuclease ABC subunit C